jgi:hypothetical protein
MQKKLPKSRFLPVIGTGLEAVEPEMGQNYKHMVCMQLIHKLRNRASSP